MRARANTESSKPDSDIHSHMNLSQFNAIMENRFPVNWSQTNCNQNTINFIVLENKLHKHFINLILFECIGRLIVAHSLSDAQKSNWMEIDDWALFSVSTKYWHCTFVCVWMRKKLARDNTHFYYPFWTIDLHSRNIFSTRSDIEISSSLSEISGNNEWE